MGMMGKALLPRASESVLHAEKRRLLWGAKPFKAIGYSSSVSCSPVIPGRYRIPVCQMSGTCSWPTVRTFTRVAARLLHRYRTATELHQSF